MTEHQHTIVVGVDGSAAGDGALRWAVRQAGRRHDRVHAISVRDRDELLPATSFALQPHGRAPATDEGTAHHRLRAVLRAATDGMTDPPEVLASVRTGDPATELIKATEGADMLVVGSHGHHPLSELLLGSVAAACVRRAHCPVVITPVAVRAGAGEHRVVR